ncbi:MAG: galactose mutarotase-like enzyme, partial [Bacteroidia bacterium]
NEQLKIQVNSFGAELWSIQNKNNNTHSELLWQGDEAFWPRRAPILFPIVGRLIDDAYTLNGKFHNLRQHGFARERDFVLTHKSNTALVYQLLPDVRSLRTYPFNFEFNVRYELNGSELKQTFEVVNHSTEIMPSSFGAHPAFNTPAIEKAELVFEKTEDAFSDRVVEGIREGVHLTIFNKNKIALNKHSFDDDALIFTALKSSFVDLFYEDKAVVRVSLSDFTHLGIWAKPGAPFVCIEPWCGVADKHDHDGNILTKEGIFLLKPGEHKEATMCIEVL